MDLGSLGSLVGLATGGVGAVVGVAGAAYKYGKKIKQASVAAKASKEAWVEIGEAINAYNEANADGTITPDEITAIFKELGEAVVSGMEAQAAVEKLIGK